MTAGCDHDGQRPADHGRCVAACSAWAERVAEARCGAELARYLGCVGASRLGCTASSPASVRLERGEGIAACTSEHQKLAECFAPCEQVGVAHLVDRADGGSLAKAEIVRAGCAACGPLRAGAPSGARCEAASVCGDACCDCPDGRAHYRVRACLDGVCASAESACRDGKSLSPRDPCGAE